MPVFVLIVMLRTRSATLTGMDLGEKKQIEGYFFGSNFKSLHLEENFSIFSSSKVMV